MAGISKAERERRAAAKAHDDARPMGVTAAEWTPEARARMNAILAQPLSAGRMVMLPPDVDVYLLHAICAALPFSGKPNGQGVISFEDRLADAKVKARLILEASCES